MIGYVELKSGIISQSESPISGKMDVLILYTYVITLQGFPTSCKYCIEPESKVYETAIKSNVIEPDGLKMEYESNQKVFLDDPASIAQHYHIHTRKPV